MRPSPQFIEHSWFAFSRCDDGSVCFGRSESLYPFDSRACCVVNCSYLIVRQGACLRHELRGEKCRVRFYQTT